MKNTQEQKIEYIVSRMLADRTEDAPADVIKYTRNLFRSRAAEPKASVLKRVFAILQVDLAPHRAAFGERSATGAQARQMLFEAGEHAIDLRITTTGNKVEIKGQILGSGFEDGEIELTFGKTSAKTKVAGAGRFEFSGLPTAEFAMTITGPESHIVIEKIDLK